MAINDFKWKSRIRASIHASAHLLVIAQTDLQKCPTAGCTNAPASGIAKHLGHNPEPGQIQANPLPDSLLARLAQNTTVRHHPCCESLLY